MDPSVNFGLRFSMENGGKPKSKSKRDTDDDAETTKNAEVVDLDSFRKKSGGSK